MAPEYYEWLANLNARDTFALISTLLALVAFLFQLRYFTPRPPSLRFDFKPCKCHLRATLAIGLFLRLFLLGSLSLWHDEALSALTAQRGWFEVLTVAKGSAHPPTYYGLLKIWSSLYPFSGLPSEFWLRLPSAIIGTVNIWAMYKMAKAWGRNEQEALLAALLMAIMPFSLFYSREVRMYEFLLAGGLITLWGYAEKRGALLVAGGLLMMYFQSLGGALLLGSIGLLALVDRDRLKLTILSGGLITLGYLPWAAYGWLEQVSRIAQNFWVPQVTLGGFAFGLHTLLWGEAQHPLIMLGLILSLMMVLNGMFIGWQDDKRLLGLFLLPMLLNVALSYVVQPVFVVRSMITTLPALFMLMALMLLSQQNWRRVFIAMVIISLSNFYLSPMKWPNKQWSQIVASQYNEGDTIIFVQKLLPLWWYNYGANIVFLSDDENHPTYGFVLTNEAAQALGMTLVELEQPLPKRGQGVVVFARSPSLSPRHEQYYNGILHRYPIVWSKQFVEDSNQLSGEITVVNLSMKGGDER